MVAFLFFLINIYKCEHQKELYNQLSESNLRLTNVNISSCQKFITPSANTKDNSEDNNVRKKCLLKFQYNSNIDKITKETISGQTLLIILLASIGGGVFVILMIVVISCCLCSFCPCYHACSCFEDQPAKPLFGANSFSAPVSSNTKLTPVEMLVSNQKPQVSSSSRSLHPAY